MVTTKDKMKNSGSKVFIEKVGDIASYEGIKKTMFLMLDQFKENYELKLSANSKVLIKLNLCLLKGPETGATVDPRVAKALVEWLLKNYNLEKIYLAEADATHLSADMAFKILGWSDLFADIQKVELFNLSRDDTVLVKGKYINDLRMSRTMMDSDFLISLAKLKTHIQEKITGIMKNQFGAIPYKYKIIYHPKLTGAIYDATAARVPDLCIIDGLISMEGNGPTNGIPRRTKLLISSNDAISVDHLCAKMMGFKPMSVPHLRLAVKHKLGDVDYEIVGTPPNPLNLKFRFLPKWKELLKKAIGIMQVRTINEET
jgi:uncharacterized protein (DUF362 family)